MAKGAALVTGGAKRIGREIALRLAAEGYDIALHYSTSEAEAKQTAKDIESTGAKCRLFKADLADMGAVAKLAADVKQAFPGWNILINNASIFERANLAETTEELFDRHLAINLKAPLFLTQAFAGQTKTGSVVMLLDSFIHKNTGAFFSYLLSKKSLADLVPMAARALAPSHRVNGVALGYILPSITMTAEEIEAKNAALPAGRSIKPTEIADAVFTLLSKDYLNGEILHLDAGMHL